MSPASGTERKAGDARYRIMFGCALAAFLADQLTKAAVTAVLPLYSGITVVPGFFDLVHVLNRGAAFGFLNRPDTDWQFWLFLLATLVACGLILSMARTARYSVMLFCGFGLILGGAVGNLADRIRLRAVIDFMDIYLGRWHWPAFNVADMAICIGVVLAGLALWRGSGAPSRRNASAR